MGSTVCFSVLVSIAGFLATAGLHKAAVGRPVRHSRPHFVSCRLNSPPPPRCALPRLHHSPADLLSP